MGVIEFLSEIGPLSPEGRYLFLAIIFQRMNDREKRIDVSVSHLRDSFGVSHKVVSELLEYLQYHRVGEVTKARHGKHEFTFDSVYFNSLAESGFLSIHEAFVEVFSPEVKTVLKKKELKLRPSNLLLIGIFILHANELGFIQPSASWSGELLSEGKIRRLMGGISQSRLKSQLATLRSIGFIRREASGGVSQFYFGKFGKRYQIDLGFLLLSKSTTNALFINETFKNVSDFIYETPKCYLVYAIGKTFSLQYEFDFELPFKLSFLIGKKLWLKSRHKMKKTYQQETESVDNFNLHQLELAPFLRFDGLTRAILAKLETLTASILINHWQSLTEENFEKLEELLESNSELQKLVSKDSIFTQRYLLEQNDPEPLESVYCFWKSSLLSLSYGLAMSLAKVIRGHCGNDADLKIISLFIHDFRHYSYSRGKYPSCDIAASYIVDGSTYDLNIVGSKSYISETLVRRSVIEVDLDNIMIKKHTTYSIWAKSNT